MTIESHAQRGNTAGQAGDLDPAGTRFVDLVGGGGRDDLMRWIGKTKNGSVRPLSHLSGVLE